MEHHKFEGEIDNITPAQLEFIKNVIEEEGFKDSKVTFEAVGAAGDNYAASVKRIIVEGENGNLTMIAKIAPTHEIVRKTLSAPLMFNNEYLMYKEVLPKLLSLQKQAEIPEKDQLRFPKCYGASVDAPNEVILIEDLKPSGFGMQDRLKPLADEYVKSVLRNLAIYHSLSYVLKNKEPETYNYYRDNLGDMWGAMANKRPEELTYFRQIEAASLKMLDNIEHQNIMRHKVSEIVARAAKMSKFENGSRYAVIQHGDCWTNNVMFKFEDDTLQQSILIDYQLCKNSSPANDILYLIFNCTDHETRVKNFYDWLDYYHTELDKSLSNYGLKSNYVYPRDQLDADVKRYGKLAFGCAVITLGVLNLNPEEARKLQRAFASPNTDDVVAALADVNADTLALTKKRLSELVESFVAFGLL
ncbi:hypothetical protein PYW07_006580 [Mythimna separata]|uniref:CHK kinase-like domain-containing protein n=1 Tax=Mythimna separata TaxID=271217 RepID=A0AAD8DXS3_MYTSE|nr:hypothetical protein PYW07_006580 [Mythimna separata]